MEQKTENVEQISEISFSAYLLMPSITKGQGTQATLNNRKEVVRKSKEIAKSLVKLIEARFEEEKIEESELTIICAASEQLGAFIEDDFEGTFSNLESRTKVAIDMVIELNESVEKLDENVNEEEEQ